MRRLIILALLFSGLVKAQSFDFECSVDNIKIIDTSNSQPVDWDNWSAITISLENLPEGHGIAMHGIWLGPNNTKYFAFHGPTLSWTFIKNDIPEGFENWDGKFRWDLRKVIETDTN